MTTTTPIKSKRFELLLQELSQKGNALESLEAYALRLLEEQDETYSRIRTCSNAELVNYFLDTIMEQGHSFHTVTAYRSDLDTLTKFAGDKRFADFDFLDVKEFVKYLKRTDKNGNPYYKANSVRRKYACVSTFFTFLEVDLNLITTNYFKSKRIKPVKKKDLNVVQDFLTVEECDLLLKTIKESPNTRGEFTRARDYFLYRLILKTGLRIEEACELQDEHLHWETNSLEVIDGKGNKDRTTCLPPELKEDYDAYMALAKKVKRQKDNKSLIITNRGGKVSTTASRTALIRYGTECGLYTETRHITNHKLRHSFATNMAAAGISDLLISKYLGHSSLQITGDVYVSATCDLDYSSLATKLKY